MIRLTLSEKPLASQALLLLSRSNREPSDQHRGNDGDNAGQSNVDISSVVPNCLTQRRRRRRT